MALNFPANPTVGDVYTFGGSTYRWSGSGWEASHVGAPQGPIGYTGSQGASGTPASVVVGSVTALQQTGSSIPTPTVTNSGSSSAVTLDFGIPVPYRKIARMTSDVVNNSATANTLVNIPELQIPVVAGVMTQFSAMIWYTAQQTTGGSRWTIHGPAATALCYSAEYSLAGTTTTTVPNSTSYQLPNACNASSGSVTSNKAQVWGFVVPSENGFVTIQFAAERDNVAITAKAGSTVEWW